MSGAAGEPRAEGEGGASTRHPSSMRQRLGWLHRLLARFAFARVHVEPRLVERVRELSKRGTIVYVMRHRSVADYLLATAALRREGLPLAELANGISIGWFRTIGWILRRVVARLSRGDLFDRRRREREDRATALRLVEEGKPILVFLRTRAVGLQGLAEPRGNTEQVRIGDPYLADVFASARRTGREVFVVPLAPIRGRSYRRREGSFEQLLYSVRDAPNEGKKLVTFLFNRNDLALSIGREIRLGDLIEKYPGDEPEKLSRRLARVLLLFLHREERVVWGPPLRPKSVVREIVIGAPETQAAIARIAGERGIPRQGVEREARADFDEMAASFNGLYFSILAFVFRRVWHRMFSGVGITGLDRVAEKIREHPVVLVPCHRSHFDYLVLTWIFHSNFLSPPHIAAGINLSFFPLGMLFRGAGAFFIRRSFGDDQVYKTVFRQYLTVLIREGYTQEFFIEGGRSRTGKILTPKLGMLGAIVDAYLHDRQGDLYLVPVSIDYERLVEEEAYKRELQGRPKEKENLGALVRARSVLRGHYGKVNVAFGEPISLASALGPLRETLVREPDDADRLEEKRRFVLKLGFRLLGGVNEAASFGASSVAATVLLCAPRAAMRRSEFESASRLLVDLAEREGARLTESLRRDRLDFAETLAFLERAGLVRRLLDPVEGEILVVPEDKRLNLDFYKNNGIHLFVVASLVASARTRGVRNEELETEVRDWLDLFRNEFVLPEPHALARTVGVLARTVGGEEGSALSPTGRLCAPILECFFEAYWVAAERALSLPEDGLLRSAWVASAQQSFEVKRHLGRVRRPEGNTTVTLENALRRYEEMRFVRFEPVAKGDARVLRGAAFESLAPLVRRLEQATVPATAADVTEHRS